MKIIIHPITKQHFTLDVDQKDTVATVKDKIYKRTNYPVDQQDLIFDYSKLYDDDRTLAECDIHDGAELQLRVRFEWLIKVILPRDFVINVSIDPETTTAYDIKAITEDKTKMPAIRQQLFFNGKNLEDDAVVSEYGVQNGSVLVCRGELELFVIVSGKQIVVQLGKDDRVAMIRHEIAVQDKFRYVKRRLVFNGKELDDNKCLKDYGIVDKSVIECFETPYPSDDDCIELTVRALTGKTFHFKFDQNLLTLCLFLSIQAMDNVPVRQQRLIYQGKRLDSARSFKDYGIKSGDVIQFVLCLCGC